MYQFETHSLEPGLIITPETGEQEIIPTRVSVKKRVGLYISPGYSQQSIDLARLVTSKLGEEVICNLLGGKKEKRKNHKGSDIILPGGIKLEAKIGRIGNSAVIKKNQLEYLNKNGLFGIVYYRTTGNEPPSYFTSQDNGIKPEVFLKRNIKIENLFIFPRSHIVYFYNKFDLIEGQIISTGINHKPLCRKNAMILFNKSKGYSQVFETTKNFERQDIKVFSVGYEIK